jgi:hypothetical protein
MRLETVQIHDIMKRMGVDSKTCSWRGKRGMTVYSITGARRAAKELKNERLKNEAEEAEEFELNAMPEEDIPANVEDDMESYSRWIIDNLYNEGKISIKITEEQKRRIFR